MWRAEGCRALVGGDHMADRNGEWSGERGEGHTQGLTLSTEQGAGQCGWAAGGCTAVSWLPVMAPAISSSRFSGAVTTKTGEPLKATEDTTLQDDEHQADKGSDGGS